MQRRIFVKKSVAAAFMTPLALTGLINAAGATETGETTETTWFTTEGTTSITTVAPPPCVVDQEHEFLDVKNDANGNPLLENGMGMPTAGGQWMAVK